MKSFTKFFALMMAMLVSFGMMAQSDQEFQYLMQQQESLKMMQLKQDASQGKYDPADFPPPSLLQGGEDVGTAVVISSLPYSDAGTTSGYINDYEGTCGSTGAPDVVYSFTPTVDYFVTMNLCNSSYDTKVYVFENTANNTIGCNDDACGLQSILVVEMTAGNTYYIVVDGYGSSSGSYDMVVTGIIPPPSADPITSFPFEENFENCDFPDEIQPKWGTQCTASVLPAAAFESDCGAQLSGTSYNWFYYSANCQLSINNNIPLSEGGNATGSYGNHWAKMVMDVEPDGTAGSMQLDFDFNFHANYSFGYYNAFQVWINGAPVMEKELQEDCFRGELGGSGWSKMVFDLSAWQNDPQFDLELVFIGAYGNDKVWIDNVSIWYVPSGNVEGLAYNGDITNLLPGVEIGFLAENPPYPYVMTDATGYYRFSNVPTEPINPWAMYAFLDGMNYIEADVWFITGQTVTHHWNMASPFMVITPAVLEETMNPNEWRSVPISITNGPIGGPLHWTAEIFFDDPPTKMSNGTSTPLDITDPNFQHNMYLEAGDPAESMIEFEIPGGSREIVCPDESVFGNNITNPTNAYTTSGTWYCQQQFLDATGSFGKVIFWIVYTSVPVQPQNFVITVYEANGNSPGTIESATDVTLTGVLTSETVVGFQVFQFEAELPVSDLENGFIGIKATYNPSYWSNTFDPGASGVALQNGNQLPERLAMCLIGAAGGGWLDLSAYEGDVAPGDSDFVDALFDATGTEAGQVWTADIVFIAQPNISIATVDVSMIIAGEPLVPVEEFTAELVNAATGQVDMAWTGVTNITFEYYLVRRDGAPIANTQNTSYTDMLPTYGDYCYTVSAVYFEGESVPAGPECVSWFIPELCFAPVPVYGEVWVGESDVFQLFMENCGEGVLSFAFDGFEDPDFSNGFVTGVSPFAGTIAEGETLVVDITFDAANYGAGTYNVNIDLLTNELAPNNERPIACSMLTYVPATVYGIVLDCDDSFPISNVDVIATETTSGAVFTGQTGANGYYEFFVDQGTYDFLFTKLSYQNFINPGVYAPAGQMTEVNAVMCEVPYPVQWVHADPNEADTECMVTWSLPMGPYEIIYDDGSAENFFSWTVPGGGVGVKFTPAGYPAQVIAGRLFVGDGSFPVGANFLGSTMSVGVMDDDGPNGMPGTILDSVEVTVNNYGWVTFGLNGSTFTEGNFYVVMWQTVGPPFGAPVGIDNQNPTTFRSRVQPPGGEWMISAYNDFMIRATVMGPGDNVNAYAEGPMVVVPKPTDGLHIAQYAPSFIPGREQPGKYMPVVVENSGDRDFVKYKVAFVDGFDPDAGQQPWDGTLHVLGTTTANQYNDTDWGGQPAGFYAYAVQAMYESNNSIWVYSNVAAHLKDFEVIINVTQCDGEEPSNAAVFMMGQNYPYQMLVGITPASGTVVFDSVIKGVYDLSVVKLSYQAYEHPDLIIASNYVENVVLQENEHPPRNLYVDPLTSIATWDEPLNIQVEDGDFENEPFPPVGWQSTTSGIGWERTQDGSSSFWTIPAPPAESGDWYAVSNDDQNSGNNGCCDYLITPECDLRESPDYALTFIYFYNAMYGGSAYVEYSTDGGASWTEVESMTAVASWTPAEIDLSDFSGPDGESSIWFAFHYDDNGGWADGWAIDNVFLANGPDVDNVLGYHVYLDGNFDGQTTADTLTYQYQDLHYGQVYVASVAALYGCNLSDKIYYTFTSGYLYPPRNLFDEYLYNTNEVPLFWNPPMTGPNYGPNSAYPKYDNDQVEIEFGQVEDVMAFNRSTSGDVVISTSGTRTVGDVLYQFGPSGMSLPWGCGFDYDQDFIYLTDPLSFPTTVFQYDYNTGDQTGVEFTISMGQAWIGDMAYYDGILYCLLVGGPNSIVPVDIATGELGTPITGSAWAGISQRGLGVDGSGISGSGDIEFFVGGWNTNIMFHIDYTGAVISQSPWSGISGMAWHPMGGPDAEGSVWVMTNAGTSTCTEFDPMNGWANLQAFNIPGNTSFSGAGLAMNGDGNLWMPNQPDVQVYLVDTEEPFTGGGPGIPEGLMEFKVYRDLMHVGTVAYDGEGLEDTLGFVDNPVDPGCYDYTVTAVYDLTDYGFPGQTGESMHEGPDTVCVVWGYDLPFMEAWDSGNFGFNGWRVDAQQSNWVVSNVNGNDKPSAQFNWDPDPEGEYELYMSSAPLKADLYTEGKIWMDFEYALSNRVATGDEYLGVEVYNGQEWFQVFALSNMDSYDYTPVHVDISAFAMGRVFMVRFVATGLNSFDIINWNVDNIHIYRSCDAPKDLDGEYLWNDVDDYGAEIWWEAPDIPVPPEGWVRWDNGNPAAPVGLAEGGDWSAAIRWDAGELAEYVGTSITEIQFYMADDSFDHIKVKIWQGMNAGMLLHESDSLHPDSAMWTTYTVDPPVPIDVLDELWVGYTIVGQLPNTFPASMDAGPAETGKGDKISTDGSTWDNASDFGLNGNWNIAAYLKQPDNAPASVLPFIDTHVYNNNGDVTLVAGPPINGAASPGIESSRDFTGFRIYRKGPNDIEYDFIAIVPYEEGTNNYSYYDENPYPDETGAYDVCYQVTAAWESDTDYCESDPARAELMPIDDYICMTITSIDNPLEDGITALYPNPASNLVNVASSYDISRITIFNYVGQVVYDAEINAERSLSLNVATYDAGVYIVKIETDNGMVTKRLAITK